MNRLPTLVLVALVACAQLGAGAVTPVEKVITLLTDLKNEVADEGKNEATTYDAFACFCKDTTKTKSDAITEGNDEINSLSASISEDTAEKVEKSNELDERKVNHETLSKSLDETVTRCQKEEAEYDATAADLSKAISSLEKAIKSMEDSGSTYKTTKLVQVTDTLRKSVEEDLALAAALNLITEPNRKAVSTFLQGKAGVDPKNPAYAYHSDGILQTLEKLLGEFRTEKATLDTEWGKTFKTCTDVQVDLSAQIKTNGESMDELTIKISGLSGTIASSRTSLVEAEGFLKDDQQYLKELTERCESRANDWDQRSALRKQELGALAGALEVLESRVSGADQSRAAAASTSPSPPVLVQRPANSAAPAAPAKQASIAPHAPAFVQEVATVHRARASLRARSGLSMQARGSRVVEMLSKEGRRLNSPVLSTLATKIKLSDPFTKIKGLIQELIERLLAESTAEATKKGFCDTEMGKAEKDRDFRMKDAKDLNLELTDLEIKKEDLEAEIALLTEGISSLKQTLDITTGDRKTEHGDNVDSISIAKGGLAAVREAITILKVFYKTAAKAQAFVQASPLDEDTTGAGFKGNYAGKQESSKGIIGMLEVIESDFDRTVRATSSSEKQAQEEFVVFDRTSKADIAGKETKLALDNEDLVTTDNTLTQKMADLQTAVNLLDDALKKLEELKPMCIDTGMSYEDRVAKREEEMAALKNALCILDTDKVEDECV